MRTVPFYYHFAERGLLMEAIRPRSVAQNPSLGKRGKGGTGSESSASRCCASKCPSSSPSTERVGKKKM